MQIKFLSQPNVIGLVLVFICIVLGTSFAGGMDDQENTSGGEKIRVIVILNESAVTPGDNRRDAIKLIARDLNVTPINIYIAATLGFSALIKAEQLIDLRTDPRVKTVERDQIVDKNQ